MSKHIEELNPEECRVFLEEIATTLQIGIRARTTATILANIQNASRRSECLSRVELCHTFPERDDETGEMTDTPLLNWGANPDDYEKRYKEIVKP